MNSAFSKILMVLILLILVLYNIGICQENRYHESNYAVILLNNGATIRGDMYENVEGKYIRIRLENGGDFKIKYNKIYAITDENNYMRLKEEFNTKKQAKKPKLFRPQILTLGGFHFTESRNAYQLAAIGFYNLNKHSRIGLGLSYVWENGTKLEHYDKLTVLVEYRQENIFGFKNTFVYTNLGLIYQIEAGLGINIKLGKAGFITQAGYKYLSNEDHAIREMDTSGLSVNIGFIY